MVNWIKENSPIIMVILVIAFIVVITVLPARVTSTIEGNLQNVEFVSASFNMPDAIIVSFTDGRVIQLKGTAYGKNFVKGRMNRISLNNNIHIIKIEILD